MPICFVVIIIVIIICYYYLGVLAGCLKLTFTCTPELFNLLNGSQISLVKISLCTTLVVFYLPSAEKHM